MKLLPVTLLGVPMNWLDIGLIWSTFKEMMGPIDILWAEAYSQRLPVEFYLVAYALWVLITTLVIVYAKLWRINDVPLNILAFRSFQVLYS